jgi:hypothetical protein
MNRSVINLKEIASEYWKRIGERFMDMSSQYEYRAPASAECWHLFIGNVPPKSRVKIGICKDDFCVSVAEEILRMASLQFEEEHSFYKKEALQHYCNTSLEFFSSRIPANEESIYQRLLKKAGKVAPSEWYDENWKVSAREHSLERNRDAILRFYRDFISVANLTPERRYIHDMIGYDE